MISLIVAFDENQLIGKDGWMPWNLPEDLAHFKAQTLNKKLLMGRKTFELIGKPLPQRYTYVLTRQPLQLSYDNVEVIHDLQALLAFYQDSEETLMVCGGGEIYEQTLPYVHEMWISLVEGTYQGDTYFPRVPMHEFDCLSIDKREQFTIFHYQRKEENV